MSNMVRIVREAQLVELCDGAGNDRFQYELEGIKAPLGSPVACIRVKDISGRLLETVEIRLPVFMTDISGNGCAVVDEGHAVSLMSLEDAASTDNDRMSLHGALVQPLTQAAEALDPEEI